MITSFRSSALKKLWIKNDASGVRPEWRDKIKLLLTALDAAIDPQELNVIGFGFHALRGNLMGRFALTVSRNWRITFGWSNADATNVDLEDYHGQ